MGLESKRYILREIAESDIQDIFKGLSHPKVIKYYGVSFLTLEETKEQMKWYSDLKANNTGIWWKIIHKSTGDFVGAGGYNDLSTEHRKAEIGFWLLPEYWGLGIMPEVMAVILNFGFENLNLNRIEGYVERSNSKCKSALKKLNFSLEGTMRETEVKDGQFIDVDIYAMIKSDFEKINPKNKL